MVIRQMSEIEIQAIKDFLHETHNVGIDDDKLLCLFQAHQKKLLAILDKFKKEQ